MALLLQALKSGIFLLSLSQSFALALNIPIHRCDPKHLSLHSSSACVSATLSSLGNNISSSSPSLNTLPLPPAPYFYTTPDSHIGMMLSDYGDGIPIRQGHELLTAWLNDWNDITNEGDPALEERILLQDYVWSKGPVRITLRPKLAPIPNLRWLDVYGLILLMTRFLRQYIGFVEAEIAVVGKFPGGSRPNILLGHATLELVNGVRR